VRRLVFALLAVAALAAAVPALATVRVSGNRLVDGTGNPVRLLGVNRSGTEYACIQGWGIFDGPSGDGSIAAMKSWKINAVRVPLNEDCWLGINGVDDRYGGKSYRHAIAAFVGRLHDAHLVPILELHWTAPGAHKATGQRELPDRSHGIAFWKSVATAFKGDRNLVFDLYNEPHGVTWRCWRDGCRVNGAWKAAGMQALVNAVRGTGAKQPLMLGGLAWSNDLSHWLRWKPRDPRHQLVASYHVYNFNTCSSASCWNATIAPVAAKVPLVTGELGEDDCAHGFIDTYMDWADAHGLSYLGWTWDTWDCSSGPALISGYDGTPTAFGVGFRDHLAGL
jgi:endoglucanase